MTDLMSFLLGCGTGAMLLAVIRSISIRLEVQKRLREERERERFNRAVREKAEEIVTSRHKKGSDWRSSNQP